MIFDVSRSGIAYSVDRRVFVSSVRDHVWRPINRPMFGVADSISERIRAEEWRWPGLLTPVSQGPTLLVVSDYAGDHSRSRFHSICVLVADLAYLWYWDEVRIELRRDVLRDSRRLEYKKLESDHRRARALVPFLRASNSIPGLLITFLIDKRIKTLFSPDAETDPSIQPAINRDHWGAKAFEKLFRIAHLGSLLVSGLVGERQDVLWVSDQDEIVPNDARHIEACKLLGQVQSHYLNTPIGRLQFGTTRSDDGSLRLEDIAALPDLAAGCLADVATSMAVSGAMSANEVLTPMSRDISKKAQTITAWLAEKSHTLKKLAFVIDFVPPDLFKSKLFSMFGEGLIPEYNCVPDLARRLRRQNG